MFRVIRLKLVNGTVVNSCIVLFSGSEEEAGAGEVCVCDISSHIGLSGARPPHSSVAAPILLRC